PTLATGIIGLATLMAMQALFGILRAKTGIGRILDREPILLMFDGVVVRNGLQKSHFIYDDVRTLLCNAGIGVVDEDLAMILEASRVVSIVRGGVKLEQKMLEDVRGAEELIAPPKQEPRA